MLEKEEIRYYYYTKFLQSYLYDEEIYEKVRNGFFDFYVLNEEFLMILINYIELYANNEGNSDLIVKDKFYFLIDYIRYKVNYQDDEIRKYYHNIFNELIIKLNLMDKSNSYLDWIINEYVLRTDSKLGNQISLKKFKMFESFVRESVGYDFLLLTFFVDDVDEKMFDESIELLANDKFCLASLNAVIKQCPKLLSETIFKRRVKKILEYNRKNIDIKSNRSLSEKLFVIRQNSKHYKNFKKLV